MKALFLCLFTLAAATAHAGKIKWTAEQTEAWNLFMANAVAYQPAAMGPEKFVESMGMKTYFGPGQQLVKSAPKKAKWPVISRVGNALKIGSGKNAVLFEMVDPSNGIYALNGRQFKINREKPLLNQVREVLKPSVSDSGFSLFPLAIAAEVEVDPTVTTSWTVAALAGGVGGFGIYCAGRAMDYWEPGTLKGEGFWQKMKTCGTAELPLPSWLKSKKPVDEVSVNCRTHVPKEGEKYKIISVELKTGPKRETTEIREFVRDPEGKLANVTVSSAGTTYAAKVKEVEGEAKIVDSIAWKGKIDPARKLSRANPNQAAQLDKLQPLVADFNYYQGLCEDPARLKEVEANAGSGKRPSEPFREFTPADVFQKSEEDGAGAPNRGAE